MLPTKIFKKKQFIYSEGETANEMYIIVNGIVKVIKSIKNNPVKIATLEKGSFLGEVALFRNEKHGATAVVETDTEVAVINKETFDKQIEILPNWFKTLIRNMADRLHSSVEQLSDQSGEPMKISVETEKMETKSEPEKFESNTASD